MTFVTSLRSGPVYTTPPTVGHTQVIVGGTRFGAPMAKSDSLTNLSEKMRQPQMPLKKSQSSYRLTPKPPLHPGTNPDGTTLNYDSHLPHQTSDPLNVPNAHTLEQLQDHNAAPKTSMLHKDNNISSYNQTTPSPPPVQLNPPKVNQGTYPPCNETTPSPPPDQPTPSTFQRFRAGISKLLTAVSQIFVKAPTKNNEKENSTEKANFEEGASIEPPQHPEYIKLNESPFCPSCVVSSTNLPVTSNYYVYIPLHPQKNAPRTSIFNLKKGQCEYMDRYKLSQVYDGDKRQALKKVCKELHLPIPSGMAQAFFLKFCPHSILRYIEGKKTKKLLEIKVPELVLLTHGSTLTEDSFLLIILKWLIVGSLIDDRLDKTTLEQSKTYNAACYTALSTGELPHNFRHLPPDIRAYVNALQDLHCDLKEVANNYSTDFNILFKGFLDQVKAQHESTVSEAEFRAKSIDKITYDEFFNNRKKSLGFYEMLKLDMGLKGLTNDDIKALNDNQIYAQLIEVATENILLLNDLVSFEKEVLDALGDDAAKLTHTSKYNDFSDKIKKNLPPNGILIKMKQENITLGDAIQYFLNQHEITAKDVEKLVEQLLKQTSLSDMERNLVQTIRNWVSGHVKWCYETGRYVNKQRFLQNKTKINSVKLNDDVFRLNDDPVKTINDTGI